MYSSGYSSCVVLGTDGHPLRNHCSGAMTARSLSYGARWRGRGWLEVRSYDHWGAYAWP